MGFHASPTASTNKIILIHDLKATVNGGNILNVHMGGKFSFVFVGSDDGVGCVHGLNIRLPRFPCYTPSLRFPSAPVVEICSILGYAYAMFAQLILCVLGFLLLAWLVWFSGA